MPAVVFVFCLVTACLPVKVDLVLFGIGSVEIFRRHFQNLGDGNQKMQQVNYLDAGVLFVKLLVLGPPFPRNAVGQLGNLLGHRTAVIQNPLLALLVSHAGGVYADFEIEGLLHLEDFVELVGFGHTGIMRELW